jgi:putative metalloprotease
MRIWTYFFTQGEESMKVSFVATLAVSACVSVMLAGCETQPTVKTADKSTSKKADAGSSSGGGVASALGGLSSLGGAGSSGSDDQTSNVLGAVGDLAKASSITDAEVKQMSLKFSKQSDASSKVASAGSPYAKRLAKLTGRLTRYDGMNLNYKVYMSDTVNAFAMADGTVRVYSGLMDLMTDDELRFVIGHEIGHVKMGHSAASIRNAYQSSALVKGATAVAAGSKGGSAVLSIGGDQLKGLFEKALTSAHSRGQESESDAYSVKFMKANKIPTKAASTALLKLATGNRGSTFLSTHPDPAARAEAVEVLAAK